MKLQNEGNATYIDHGEHQDLWSYQSLVARYYPNQNGVVFYENYDYSKTTSKHLTLWFREHLGVVELGNADKRAKAIKDGEVQIRGRRFKVALLDSKKQSK